MKHILLILLFTSASLFSHNLREIVKVIKVIETQNNNKLIGDEGKAFGILQIHKICIEDVNRIYGTVYVHERMFEEACAEEVFFLALIYGIKIYTKKYKPPLGKNLS